MWQKRVLFLNLSQLTLSRLEDIVPKCKPFLWPKEVTKQKVRHNSWQSELTTLIFLKSSSIFSDTFCSACSCISISCCFVEKYSLPMSLDGSPEEGKVLPSSCTVFQVTRSPAESDFLSSSCTWLDTFFRWSSWNKKQRVHQCHWINCRCLTTASN